MKKQFTPIAMLCNKEQFEAIKPKLDRNGNETFMIGKFKENTYLVLFDHGGITNGSEMIRENYIIHETWNERIFLKACGVETYQITKETILKYKMKDEFPEVFNVKLEVGKWYKRPHNKALFFIVGDPEITPFEVYGFDMEGNWMNVEKARIFPDYEIEATEQEVLEALKNEAVKRGFGQIGIYFNSLDNDKCISDIEGFDFWNLEKRDSDENKYNIAACKYGGVIFRQGIWAEIIQTKTKEEAEKLLNCKILN